VYNKVRSVQFSSVHFLHSVPALRIRQIAPCIC